MGVTLPGPDTSTIREDWTQYKPVELLALGARSCVTSVEYRGEHTDEVAYLADILMQDVGQNGVDIPDIV